jgi:hypothetical protein
MSVNVDIANMRARIARARCDREAWRTSGQQVKYLESYSRVEAMELELDRLRQQGLRSHERMNAHVPIAKP